MKAEHVLLAGPSGGGKTTKARKMYALHDGIAIWVNHNEEDGLDGRSIDGAHTVTSVSEMEDLVKRCGDLAEVRNLRFNFKAGAEKGTADAAGFAKSIGKHFDGQVRTLVVVDEAHNVMPDSQDSSVGEGNPLAWMLHEGRDLGIKAVPSTQDPTELYYPPIKNCKHIVWCGPPQTFHRGFLRFYHFDDLDLPDEDHEFVVIRPSDPPEIVTRGETDERFG